MSELSHEGAFRLIVQGHLSEAERLALGSHLRTCPACRRSIAADSALQHHLVLQKSKTRPSPQFTAVYMESAARHSRRSQIMKPIYAVGGAAALALVMLAGWLIIRSNIQTTGLVDAPQLPAISVSEPQAELDNKLIEAVKGKDIAAVEQLLQEGAGADAVDAEGNSALYYAVNAVETGSSPDMVALLLNNGADPDVLDGIGQAPLALAAKNGRLEIVQLLLDAGADIDTKFAIGSGSDKSPLIQAVRAGHVEIVELLIARGADVEQQESDDYSRPLHFAAANDNPEIIRILLDEGADLSAENVWQWTPLFNAVRYSSAEIAQLLVDAGADVNALSAAGRTPMMVLIEEGRIGGMTDKMMLLLDNGADPNLQDNNGDTALHFAASTGKLEAIPLLIGHGANVNIQNNEGQTALDVAANDQTAETLREAGEVQDVEVEQTAVSKGYSLLETVPSPSLSGAIFGSDEQPVAIYLPPSYDGSDQRYPVLYILGGISDFFYEGAEVQSESLGWKMNGALGDSPSKEMITVFPEGWNSVGWGRAVSSGPVNGNVLAFIAEDVVNFVDANYRTLPDPASRGLLGLDASGPGALNLALQYPDRFGAIYLNHPWLLAPGALQESVYASPVARARVTGFIEELNALPREEAHARLLEILEENPVMYDAGMAMTYGWDYVADDELNAPYFEYLYLDEDTPNTEEVWQRWEAGAGNLDQKVTDNADALRRLNAIALSEALNDSMEPWAADGIHYLAEQLEGNEIPFEMNTYQGTLEDVYEQLKNPILPFFSENLRFEE